MQIFDVVLNSQHTVVSNLDIFSKVGRAVAYDEIIPFSVNDGQFTVSGDTSDFDSTLVIEFVKVMDCWEYTCELRRTQCQIY